MLKICLKSLKAHFLWELEPEPELESELAKKNKANHKRTRRE